MLHFLSASQHGSFRAPVMAMFQSAVGHSPRRAAVNFSPEAIVEEMQKIVRMAGEDGGDVVKGKIAMASRRLGIPFREVSRLWYGQRKNIAAHEADALRAARAGILEARRRRLEAEMAAVDAKLSALRGTAE